MAAFSLQDLKDLRVLKDLKDLNLTPPLFFLAEKTKNFGVNLP